MEAWSDKTAFLMILSLLWIGSRCSLLWWIFKFGSFECGIFDFCLPQNERKIYKLTQHCSPQEGVEGGDPLPGDFRVIVCLTPPQMNDFCDLLGTPYAPVSKIAPVKRINTLM